MKRRKRKTKYCLICGREPYGTFFYKYYCSESCRRELQRLRRKRGKEHDQIKGCYVYAWYMPGELLPFYIGKGSGARAWRKESRGVEVKILRDRLYEQEAFIVESVLIDVFRKLGAALKNKVDSPFTKRLNAREF